MSLDSAALWFGIIRDALFIFVLLFVGIALFVVYRKLSSVLESVDGTLKSTREVADAISERFAEPTSSGTGFIYGMARVLAFIMRRFRGDS